MISQQSVYALDHIVELCDKHATPDFRKWIRQRSSPTPARLPSTREVMRAIGRAIAYSRQARSDLVEALIASGKLDRAFSDFDHRLLATVRPADVLAQHWSDIGCIRQKSKVNSILKAAAALVAIEKGSGSFASYLQSFSIPRRIRSGADIALFWRQFDALQADLRKREMPFFGQTTSLLQLLLDLDFDAVKPDLIIMRLAKRIGLVEKETGDRNLREAVWSMQVYGVLRGIRPAAIDWYLLSFGGQAGAGKTLSQRFCSPGECRSVVCSVGPKGLCGDFKR